METVVVFLIIVAVMVIKDLESRPDIEDTTTDREPEQPRPTPPPISVSPTPLPAPTASPPVSEPVQKPIKPTFPEGCLDDETIYHVNPTGKFVIGGPHGDCGLTGRKIIVDTYGGMARHGGGAFSGKDPTKVDRSASYAARYVAKNLVAAGVADRVEIQLAYCIGVADPVSVNVETFGTNRIENAKIEALVAEHFDLRPGAIIRDLDLRRPLYRPVAAYGHFGRPELNLPWEKTDRADAIRSAAGVKESDLASRPSPRA